MPSRRRVLATVATAGTLSGCSLSRRRLADLSYANQTDRELRVRTVVRTTGGLFSEPRAVYDDSFRLFPTDHYRAVETNAVETGTYDVGVTILSGAGDANGGVHETRWTPAGCSVQELIVEVTPDFGVEFAQKEC
jgi:hypothetical protein